MMFTVALVLIFVQLLGTIGNGTPPKKMVAAKPGFVQSSPLLPVSCTAVPPAAAPLAGETFVTVGPVVTVKRSASERKLSSMAGLPLGEPVSTFTRRSYSSLMIGGTARVSDVGLRMLKVVLENVEPDANRGYHSTLRVQGGSPGEIGNTPQIATKLVPVIVINVPGIALRGATFVTVGAKMPTM